MLAPGHIRAPPPVGTPPQEQLLDLRKKNSQPSPGPVPDNASIGYSRFCGARYGKSRSY